MKLITAFLMFIGLNFNIFSSEAAPEAVLTEENAVVVSIVTVHSRACTEMDLLFQAVQTGDVQPYLNFCKEQVKKKVNQFLDQVVPGDNESQLLVMDAWSKGAFKTALNGAIDAAIAVAPASYQMKDLACVYNIFIGQIAKYTDTLFHNFHAFAEKGLDPSAIGLSEADFQNDNHFYAGLVTTLLGNSSLEENTISIASTISAYQSTLAGTDTDLLLQTVQTGNIQPYLDFLKNQVKNNINQFLDKIAPGDDQVSLINPEIVNNFLRARTKGAFKAALYKRIDATNFYVSAPTSSKMADLRRIYNNVAISLYHSIHTLMDGFLPYTRDVLDPGIDQNLLSIASSRDDIRSINGLMLALGDLY